MVEAGICFCPIKLNNECMFIFIIINDSDIRIVLLLCTVSVFSTSRLVTKYKQFIGPHLFCNLKYSVKPHPSDIYPCGGRK